MEIIWTDHVTMKKYCVESRGKEHPTQNKRRKDETGEKRREEKRREEKEESISSYWMT